MPPEMVMVTYAVVVTYTVVMAASMHSYSVPVMMHPYAMMVMMHAYTMMGSPVTSSSATPRHLQRTEQRS